MIHIKEIKKLYQVFQNEDIDRIEIRNGEEKLSFSITDLAAGSYAEKKINKSSSSEAPTAADLLLSQQQTAAPISSIHELKSNWIGFFIRINPKTGENYLKLRDHVKKGDRIGHVRVLGVLQDIRSEIAGKLKEVLVEEGQPVEYGQPLMRFEIQ